MSDTAAGGVAGVTAAGPTNKYDGATDPGVTGNSDLNFAAVAPCDDCAAPVTRAGYALGTVPD